MLRIKSIIGVRCYLLTVNYSFYNLMFLSFSKFSKLSKIEILVRSSITTFRKSLYFDSSNLDSKCFGTTIIATRKSRLLSPYTKTCYTNSLNKYIFSNLVGRMISPDWSLKTEETRSRIRTEPLSWISPMSPVWNQPSIRFEPLASSFLKYFGITDGPFIQISPCGGSLVDRKLNSSKSLSFILVFESGDPTIEVLASL